MYFYDYQLWIYFFILIRIVGVSFFIPFFSTSLLPTPVKIFLVIFVSYICLPMSTQTMPLNTDALTIVFYLLLNFTVGISIGIITQIIFSAVQFAGDFFGIQMGFALAEVLNPVYEEEVSLFSELTFLLTTMIFFIFKGHIWLYTLIIESFKKLPVVFSLNQDVFMVLSQKLGDVMIIGVEFALPITAFMLLTNISLGIASRLMPQLNVFMIGLPMNIIIGFLIFTVVIYTWEENFTGLFFQIYTWLQSTITMFAK
ncbi:MAG TPA: flagellar biosynthetic protein FliR [Petrotogaceae bacterium]|nr:flagellar biosynthetic protein FliR [Petrotogaceae bacterium]HOG33599.1 flagellar biosynthetic protein FliR [Petrotogaceae bacterium]HPX15781.1 flagellar biosynthetic protein FliR [Petrotogaceae bacterium]HQC40587.1 flagellar biosynthetic protein FliR [Petrotogaceae bacterium]HQP58064.1 flagellar biosynthetic protein FliR [Petrotogaceae bacterium]